jgi:Flp pilus assembly protein CpaB
VKRSNRLLILVGVLLAVTGAIGAMVIASGGGTKTAGPNAASPSITPEPTVQVVVAAKDIAAGIQITTDMLSTEEQPVSQVALAGDTFTDPASVSGRITAAKIKKGQIIVGSRDLLTPGSMADGQSISASIGSGMDAVTMEVDQVNGVGTVIVPGDHVDVILSVYVPALGFDGAKDTAGNQIKIDSQKDVTTKMVIQNVRVLGTLLPPPGEAAPVAQSSGEPIIVEPTAPIIQNTGRHMIVFVEVTPEQAEVIRWAQREETADAQNYVDLSLALRSSQDNDQPAVTTGGITFKTLVDKYGVLPIDQRAIIPADIAATIQW